MHERAPYLFEAVLCLDRVLNLPWHLAHLPTLHIDQAARIGTRDLSMGLHVRLREIPWLELGEAVTRVSAAQ